MLTLDLYWETKLHTAKWFLKSLSHTRCHQSPPLAMAKPSSETLCASIRTPGPMPTPSPPQAPDTKNCGGFRGTRHSCLPHRFMEA